MPDATTILDRPKQLFGPRAVWNQPCDRSPLHARQDWLKEPGNDVDYPLYCLPFYRWEHTYLTGMPINIAASDTPLAKVEFHTDQEAYPGESDDLSGGVPIPDDVLIQGDPDPYPDVKDWTDFGPGDRHCLIVDGNTLHEFYRLKRNGPRSYLCGQYSRWDMNSYAMRPNGWTSTDAAGMPIAPLLVGYDELMEATANGGVLSHALRFTQKFTNGYIWPARHRANSGPETAPPMGLRVRLKASYDDSKLSPESRTIARTLKHKGMYLTDNGNRLEVCFTYDERWKDGPTFADITLDGGLIHASDFEVVDDTYRQIGPDSMEVKTLSPTVTPMDELENNLNQLIALTQHASGLISELRAKAVEPDRVKALADKIAAAAHEFAKALAG